MQQQHESIHALILIILAMIIVPWLFRKFFL